MKWRKILKKSRSGRYYIEIDKSLVDKLEWELGDKISLEAEEVWIYSRKTKKCTIRNISKESYDRLVELINEIGPTNVASNREE